MAINSPIVPRSDRIRLLVPVFKLCNPTGMLTEFHVGTVQHFLRPLSRGVIILAVWIDGFDKIAVMTNKAR
jgi:hypothetical protein